VQPLGATHKFRCDVRIISAGCANMAELVAAGDFREDLYAALGQVKVILPPLRDRVRDVPALTRHFLARIAEQPGMYSLGITDEALSLLTAYDWPGNVRQLQATLFRAAIFCDGDALTESGRAAVTSLSVEWQTRRCADRDRP